MSVTSPTRHQRNGIHEMNQLLNGLSPEKVLHRRNHRRGSLSPQESLSKDFQQAPWPIARMLNWFLLSWITLVSVQGFFLLAGSQPLRSFQEKFCLATSLQPGACFFATIFAALHDLPRAVLLILFTLLMLLYGIGFWIGLVGKVQRQRVWLFLLLQGALFLVVCLLVQQTYLALSLYLALLLGALGMLKHVRPMLIILCYASILLLGFGYASFVSMQVLYKQGLIGSTPSWDVTNYTAFILFVIGYLLLYMQQTYAHKRLAASASRVEELTRLTERQRLARELHDTLSQGLVGLSLQLDAADALLTRQRPERAQEVVRQAMERARSTLAETRSSLDNLRAEETHASTGALLSARLHEQVAHFTGSTGLACTVALGKLTELPSVLHEPVLRMITEGLTNVARHAQARQAEICIGQHKEEVVIEVRDDGVGFDPTRIDRETGHYGLLGLRERVRLLGGQMQIESAPGKGTCLRFTIPLA